MVSRKLTCTHVGDGLQANGSSYECQSAKYLEHQWEENDSRVVKGALAKIKSQKSSQEQIV